MPETDPATTTETPTPRRGFLARLRIRKKLLVLHTIFSLSMTAILLFALRPALLRVVARAEREEAGHVLSLMLQAPPPGVGGTDVVLVNDAVSVRRGVDPRGLPPEWVERARARPGEAVPIPRREGRGVALAWARNDAGLDELWVVESSLTAVRREVLWVYGYTIGALLMVYALVAGALEFFILPEHVYQPIASLLRADRALRRGDRAAEFVPEAEMPADELGEIMRSRNESIQTIRRHESALADALARIEHVATDLRRKNHLLENARRNLADADRLVSLGMMAAGIAHELNTPLSVAKGLIEKLDDSPGKRLAATEAALLRRVVGRIERLSESLLDFARVRPPSYVTTDLREVAGDAIGLVRLDRGTPGVVVTNEVPPDTTIQADPDRLVQVMINLIRNAMDAMAGSAGHTVVVGAERVERDGQHWVLLTVTDDGPGIDPEVIGHLFEPFVSRRLDDRGTGLGLAVSEGIVREHGGTILASNRIGAPGAVFEVMLPVTSPEP